jgi:glutaconyl-CoA/methylmalonyl-CoA decarboxylase subunit gamma
VADRILPSPGSFVAELPDAEQPVSVDLTPGDGDRVVATIDGRTLELEVRPLGEHGYSIALGDRIAEVAVVRRKDEVLVSSGASQLVVKLTDRRRYRSSAAGAGGAGLREVKAVMPGKVVTVLVQVGDAVERDQPLLVLEAMKMENDVRCPSKGKVKEIRVTPGQAVETGELMIVLE